MSDAATAGWTEAPLPKRAHPDVGLRRAELRSHLRAEADGRGSILLAVPSVRCGGCIAAAERALGACEGVLAARVNLTQRRVRVTLASPQADPLPAIEALAAIGHPATPIDLAEPGAGAAAEDGAGADLIRRLAVAGFGAANVMGFSVAVWAGAEGAMRDAFHLLSAAIALPVAAYAGRPFLASALAALRAGRLNMDVPISLAVILALALSLFETVRGGEEAFFDAALTLLFFLLIGRALDQLMRERARGAVTGLARLASKGAMRLRADGGLDHVAVGEIAPGDVLRVTAGERMPVDARVTRGATDLDRSPVTGESAPVAAGPGAQVEAGALVLTGALDAVALRPAEESFLAETMRMLEAAERGRGRYVRIADRAARLYAPVVHLMALATFLGWMIATGGDWQRSIFVAIGVLIITCPCALGLAVPVAHVVGAGRLLREGVLLKDGSALERLAEVDHAVLDKTGTLTTGAPAVTGGAPEDAGERATARALALHSSHPAAGAIAAHLDAAPCALEAVREVPGQGVEGRVGGRLARLGRPGWVAEIARGPAAAPSGPAFALEGGEMASFALAETLRPHAREAVSRLRAAGVEVEILSGDAEAPVDRAARAAGVEHLRHGARPADKVARLEALRAEGARALMVGDGLNDAPALAAAHVSMAPATASDAGRQAADLVFLREELDAVPVALDVARRTARVVRQNFALAVAYNCVAVPLAVAGLVTPLVAALAMSASSILVVANSLRLGRGGAPRPAPAQSPSRGRAAA